MLKHTLRRRTHANSVQFDDDQVTGQIVDDVLVFQKSFCESQDNRSTRVIGRIKYHNPEFSFGG